MQLGKVVCKVEPVPPVLCSHDGSLSTSVECSLFPLCLPCHFGQCITLPAYSLGVFFLYLTLSVDRDHGQIIGVSRIHCLIL